MVKHWYFSMLCKGRNGRRIGLVNTIFQILFSVNNESGSGRYRTYHSYHRNAARPDTTLRATEPGRIPFTRLPSLYRLSNPRVTRLFEPSNIQLRVLQWGEAPFPFSSCGGGMQFNLVPAGGLPIDRGTTILPKGDFAGVGENPVTRSSRILYKFSE
ncbi:hypothetical protein FA13DRAFT_1189074 [Coprinellus micaceus]|uniref:Uncharacterized protein n=1 Tax=Coprinellus micaceus TaxID=71717 RepID=A0A4Y7SU99_COPMI|nr:hypothetical protein FA13DRAFT_1189074 [Coprinellus micaceus]